MLFSPPFCLADFVGDFEILEVAVVDTEDMAADTVGDTGAGIEVGDTEAFPYMLKEVVENFLTGFDKQNLAQDFLFVNSSHYCLN